MAGHRIAHGPAHDRSFGFVLGGGFLALAAIRFLWAGTISWWLLGLSCGFLLAALIVPRVLAPVRRAWMRLAAVLGFINTRILLTVVYAALITPLALLMRLFGRRPISLATENPASYWRRRRADEFTAGRMERQF